MAGHADYGVAAEHRARVLITGVLLADMDAVATGVAGKVGPVVHNQIDAALARHRQQNFGLAAHRIIVDILEPQLHAGDIAGIQRHRQRIAERRRIDARRRNQIKAAAVAQALPWYILTTVSSKASASGFARWNELRPMIEPLAPPSRIWRISSSTPSVPFAAPPENTTMRRPL